MFWRAYARRSQLRRHVQRTDGIFIAGDVSALYYWDLHDRAGEISGDLRYIAWNGEVDLAPFIHQVGAVGGSRHGMETVFAVVDPTRPDIVRKVHAELRCLKPTAPNAADSALVFPAGPRAYDDSLLFSHISRSELATVLHALTHGFRTNRQRP